MYYAYGLLINPRLLKGKALRGFNHCFLGFYHSSGLIRVKGTLALEVGLHQAQTIFGPDYWIKMDNSLGPRSLFGLRTGVELCQEIVCLQFCMLYREACLLLYRGFVCCVTLTYVSQPTTSLFKTEATIAGYLKQLSFMKFHILDSCSQHSSLTSLPNSHIYLFIHSIGNPLAYLEKDTDRYIGLLPTLFSKGPRQA